MYALLGGRPTSTARFDGAVVARNAHLPGHQMSVGETYGAQLRATMCYACSLLSTIARAAVPAQCSYARNETESQAQHGKCESRA